MRLVVLDGYTTNPGDLSWLALENLGDIEGFTRSTREEAILRIKGAAVDVLALEPPTLDRPSPLIGLDNCIITPHNAWMPYEIRKRLISLAVANLEGYLNKSNINRVDLKE